METAPVAKLVAERVRHLRRQRNWTAQQLADACADAGTPSLTRGTIAKIESGVRKSVSAAEVRTLSTVLGVTPTELLAPDREYADRRPSLSRSVLPLVDVLEQTDVLRYPGSFALYLELLADQLGEPVEVPDHPEVRQRLIALVLACAQIPGGLRALAEGLEMMVPGTREAARARAAVAELEVVDILPPGDREELLDLLDGSDQDRLRSIYRTAGGPYAPEVAPGAGYLRRLVTGLEEMNAPPDGVPPLLAFAEFAAAEAPPGIADGLRAWSSAVARRLGLTDRLGAVRRQAAERTSPMPGTTEAYLIIKIEADALEDDRYHVRTWRQVGEPWQPEPGEDFTGNLGAVQRHITDVVADAEAGWAVDADIIRLEFLLRQDLLALPVDQWPTDMEENPPRPLGFKYQVVVRSLDRMHVRRWHREWRQRWAVLSGPRWEAPRIARPATGGIEPATPRGELVVRTSSSDPVGLRRLDAALAVDHQPLLVLSRPLARTGGDTPDEVSVGLRAGVPLMLWQRDERLAEDFDSVIETLLATDRDLREGARKLRIEAFSAEDPETHVGSHITLLWDDPYRLVEPAGSLSAPR